jgi:hypothetical protein
MLPCATISKQSLLIKSPVLNDPSNLIDNTTEQPSTSTMKAMTVKGKGKCQLSDINDNEGPSPPKGRKITTQRKERKSVVSKDSIITEDIEMANK